MSNDWIMISWIMSNNQWSAMSNDQLDNEQWGPGVPILKHFFAFTSPSFGPSLKLVMFVLPAPPNLTCKNCNYYKIMPCEPPFAFRNSHQFEFSTNVQMLIKLLCDYANCATLPLHAMWTPLSLLKWQSAEKCLESQTVQKNINCNLHLSSNTQS